MRKDRELQECMPNVAFFLVAFRGRPFWAQWPIPFINYVSIVLGESGLDILIDGEQLVVPFLTFDLCMNSSLLMNNFNAYNESI